MLEATNIMKTLPAILADTSAMLNVWSTPTVLELKRDLDALSIAVGGPDIQRAIPVLQDARFRMRLLARLTGDSKALELADGLRLAIRTVAPKLSDDLPNLRPPAPEPQAEPFSFVVAVATVITYKGAVLLKQRISADGHGKWTLFGGKLDQGDTILSATLRELFEEMGLDLTEDRFTQVSYDEGVTDWGMPFVILYNKVELHEHELSSIQNKEPSKCAAVDLVDIDKLWALDMWARDCAAIEKATGIPVLHVEPAGS